MTLVRVAPTFSAMSVLETPSAARSTIRARCANPARNDGDRVHDNNTSRSASVISTPTVNGMPHDPTR